MENNIGVFICTGYGIAEALDVEALCKVAEEEYKVSICRRIESCEKTELAVVNEEIKAKNLNKILIAGISSRLYTHDMFPENVIVEKVALREHVVWCQPANEENTQMLAEDMLRMYITKLKKMEMLEPFLPEEEIDKNVLVVGGGITGITAAIEMSKAGYGVHLVEKSDRLGGWLGRQHKSIPTKPPFRDLEETNIDFSIDEIEGSDNIQVYTQTMPAEISGAPGLFDVKLKSSNKGNGDSIASFRVGAIIQATGWNPADNRESLPYGKLDDVILNVDLEDMVKSSGRITRPSDGKDAKTIAFIQCSGNREKNQHSYCSSICCLTTLKQALYLREREDTKAYIFYEFIRTPGQYEDFYRRVQEDPGVFFTRGEVSDITLAENGRLVLTARNTMPENQMQIEVDLVVLAAGMRPNSADGEAIRKLEEAKIKVTEGESETQRQRAAETIEELKWHEGTEILNLNYRQGPDLPALQYGFPDSHFICFPYESRRTGIYPAGCVRSPMDGMGSRTDAAGAALKAIQCVEMTSRGEAVHPRAGDKSYPDFFLQKCTQCKRCTEECPFGVLNEDEKGTPLLQTTRCRRCGVCMGACPERIVSFKDYSVNMIASMIKSIHVPDEDEEKPRILALLCENDAFPAMDLMGQHHIQYNPFVRVIPVRCLGSVNTVWITEAISAGFDGALLIGCKYGDDYQCHFCKGSELCVSRGENIREKLEQMAMENERVELHQLQISEYDKLAEIFNEFGEVIEKYGMNPFKGM
ncbi:MAG: FAD-dependent oxidoreductase [Candidatus Zixiibacteriota bacterium]